MGFNPPPNWPVPSGWSPPPGWDPDPEWPPAPPGWQFWTDAPPEEAPESTESAPISTRPPKGHGGRRPVVLVAVITLVLGAVVGGGYALFNRLTENPAGPVAGQLRGTFPTKPSVGWRFNADAIFDGAIFVRPDATSYQYLQPGFLGIDDTVITSAVLPSTDRGATLVALDAETGDLRWTTADIGFLPACASAAINGLLPCVGKVSDLDPLTPDPPPYVSFLRLSDGTIAAQIPVSEHVRAVAVRDSAVYTMAFDHTRMVRIITRGTTSDLTADWSREYPVASNDEGCPGSGDSLFDGTDGEVVYSGNDIGVIVADAGTGAALVSSEVSDLTVFPGQGFTARTCRANTVVATAVSDTQGTTLRTVSGPDRVATPWLVEPDVTVPYILGRTAYDFESGRELWTADDAPPLRTIIGDTVISGPSSPLGFTTRFMPEHPFAAYDLVTGEYLWTSDLSATEINLSDGQRFMVTTPDGLVALDLTTGDQLWTLPAVTGWRSVAPAGSGFAQTDGPTLTYYPPTGGPSVAPGRSNAQDNRGTTPDGLVTKCGSVPEMRPLEYRSEGGSLMVRMEVKARCPAGDVVSSDKFRVTIRDELGLIASGYFDFSKDPLTLGGEGATPTEVELEFSAGNFSRHPSSLGNPSGPSAGPNDIVTQSTSSGDELVECEDQGTDNSGATTAPETGRAPPRPTSEPVGADEPRCGTEADALAALRAQVNADRPFVQAQLANRWVAQLSSKRPGLVAPDVSGQVITWTPCEILQQHLRLRGEHPEVRLVWSDEWRTFDLAGWWVTVAGVTFQNPDAANRWCDDRRIPVDECYAKLISDAADPRGTTKYRR